MLKAAIETKTEAKTPDSEAGKVIQIAKDKKFTRRYVISGKMPLERAPDSGFFTTKFKEDAFFLGYNERALLFNNGARTEQNLSLPLHFVDEGFYKRKRLVETLGLRGANGKLAIFLQYARLPLIDPRDLETTRAEILGQAEQARNAALNRRDSQLLFDAAKLDLCDEPIIQVKFDAAARRILLQARIPAFTGKAMAIETKKGLRQQFQEYDDLICSKAIFYAMTFFHIMPSIQDVEIELWQMTDRAIDEAAGWRLEDEYADKPLSSVKRFSAHFNVTSQPLTKAEKRAADRAAKKQNKKSLKQIKADRLISLTQREPQAGDELFDGSLPNRALLLSTKVERQGFLDLEHSRANYTARKALSYFQSNYDPDDENFELRPVKPLE